MFLKIPAFLLFSSNRKNAYIRYFPRKLYFSMFVLRLHYAQLFIVLCAQNSCQRTRGNTIHRNVVSNNPNIS